MRDARFLLSGGIAALAMAACGGKVIVDTPGTGGGASTSSSGGLGGGFVTTTAVTGSAVTGTGGGVGCSNSCGDVLQNGGAVCSDTGASMNYTALYTCGCGPSVCAMACNFSLCTGTPLDTACAGCLMGACALALTDCAGS